MKKLLFIAFVCSFSILFSQAKNVKYTEFLDFTDTFGSTYNVFIVTDKLDEDGRGDSTVRIFYKSGEDEHLIEFYADCYTQKLKNGNSKISYLPLKNSTVKIIKGKDVNYSPDTFVYEFDAKTDKTTGTQSDDNSTEKVPLVFKNSTLALEDELDEINRFYFRAEPMYNLLASYYNKLQEDSNKITAYKNAFGWFAREGIAYQTFIISLYKNNEILNTIVRVRYESNGEVNIVEFDSELQSATQTDGSYKFTITPKSKTVKNIQGTAGYSPDTFTYTIDKDGNFGTGKQSDQYNSAELSYIQYNKEEFPLKFYSEDDEIYQKYLK